MISSMYLVTTKSENLSVPLSKGNMLRLKVRYCDGIDLCNIGKRDNVTMCSFEKMCCIKKRTLAILAFLLIFALQMKFF